MIVDVFKAATRRKRWPKTLGICLLVIFGLGMAALPVIRIYLIQPFEVSSGSMRPTLLAGDHILVDKTVSAEHTQRGDIIVFKFPKDTSKMFLLRVLGLPGDRVELRQKQLCINGDPVGEHHIIHSDINTIAKRDDFGPVVVPEASLFVLGDNRDQSYDSRFWGFVDFQKVLGKVKLIYWSWEEENAQVRWSRIGNSVK